MDDIRHYMCEKLVKVDKDLTAVEAARLMRDHKIGSILVTDHGKAAGIFTPADLLHRVVAEGKDPAQVKVGEVMSHPLMSIDSHQKMLSAFYEMNKHKVRHLVVTGDNKVIGILSIKDIAAYYVNKFTPQGKE
jgi:signal-transduction protein with cAMP-binding, CBS, and nucleotidyltransferase domain